MFKVGDKVRRKPDYLRQNGYHYGNDILTVVEILPNSIKLNRHMDPGWVPSYFDLIESNSVEISTTVTRGEITLPDGRVLKYTIEPKPWVPKVDDKVIFGANSGQIKSIVGDKVWVWSGVYDYVIPKGRLTCAD